jgi:hypothetical protein
MIVRGHPDVGVEVEPVELGLARATGGNVTEGWLVGGGRAPEEPLRTGTFARVIDHKVEHSAKSLHHRRSHTSRHEGTAAARRAPLTVAALHLASVRPSFPASRTGRTQ